ncbi:MAG: hypothetical protein JWR11_4529 [Mycobacterium sp.]|nr:hypothetical protein [Mycobacterium sp.]MDT5176158.1 hypothetical protein [Mycobacterium sp.]
MVIAKDPAFHQIRRTAGEAGHVSYHVDLKDVSGGPRHFAFSGNIFVGPVVVTSRDGRGRWDHQVVDDPRRFGEFVSSEWVRRFLQAWHEEDQSDSLGRWERLG